MRRALLGVFLGACGVFGMFAHGYVENTDAEITMHSARAWWRRGWPALLRQADAADVSRAEAYLAQRIHDESFLGRTGVDGRAYSCFSIGHQLLMLPCVALGEQLARWFPAPEVALAAARPPLLGEFFWTRFLVSFLPVVAAAGTVVVLLVLAHVLGATRREALLVAGVATLCTQHGAASSETLSNGPGTLLLCAAVLGCVVDHLRRGAPGALLCGGIAAGAAVLVRYEEALGVAVLGAFTAWSAWRRGRLRDVLWFVLGGLPAASLLGAMGQLRFGSPFATGYSGADAAWWSYPLHLGLPLVLFAPGKGVLWFSPPIVAAWAVCVRQRLRPSVLLLAALLWLAPILLVARTHGWHGSQCWGVRYATAGTVLLVTVALALARPWRRAPRRFLALAALGLVVTAGGVLTPYRGQTFLARHAALHLWRHEIDRGLVPVATIQDHYLVDPRLSPIHSHWTYAWHSLRGDLGPGPAERNITPVFGIAGPLDDPLPPFPREDLGFRHWWWRYLDDLVPFPWPLVLAAWLAASAVALGLGIRSWTRGGRNDGGAESLPPRLAAGA